MAVACLYFIHALTPLHAGTGQGVGVIDLPIARERATNIPLVPGSSLKGVLRDACDVHPTWQNRTKEIFGPPPEQAELHAGSLVLSDAHLLLLPVRSLAGTFAWVTSPYLLRRAARDAEDGDGAGAPPVDPPPAATNDWVGCLLAQPSALQITRDNTQTVYLEELDLAVEPEGHAAEWATWIGERVWPNDAAARAALTERICIVHDDVMGYLLNTATEVRARVRINDETKTVARGQLWYEEALPTESVLAGLAVATGVMAQPPEVFGALKALTASTLQVGGKETVGRGLCRVALAPVPADATPARQTAKGGS